jgi:hypothetical protein
MAVRRSPEPPLLPSVADILQTPWTMSTTADFAFSATRG